MKIFRFSSLLLATVMVLASCGNKAGKSETTIPSGAAMMFPTEPTKPRLPVWCLSRAARL